MRVFLSLTLINYFLQAEDGIRDTSVTGVQTCALPICADSRVQVCRQGLDDECDRRRIVRLLADTGGTQGQKKDRDACRKEGAVPLRADAGTASATVSLEGHSRSSRVSRDGWRPLRWASSRDVRDRFHTQGWRMQMLPWHPPERLVPRTG